jgi:hypothetical protein
MRDFLHGLMGRLIATELSSATRAHYCNLDQAEERASTTRLHHLQHVAIFTINRVLYTANASFASQEPHLSSKFSTMADPVSLLATSFSGLATAFKLIEFGLQVNDVPIDSLVFVELVASVEADLEHALACQREVEVVLASQPNHHKHWINGTILRVLKSLHEIGTYILNVQVDHEKSPSLARRISYVLHNYKKLSDREKWLRTSHGSLLSAITAMHMLLYPQFGIAEKQHGIKITVPTLTPDPSPTQSHTPQRDQTSGQNTTNSSIPLVPSPTCSPFESTQNLPSVLEGKTDGDESSSCLSTEESTPTDRPPYLRSETEHAYPELAHAFSVRKSSDVHQRPSRQRPSDSALSLPITSETAKHGNEWSLASPELDTDLQLRSCASLPGIRLENTRRMSDIPQRPSRQKPRPRPHSSFSHSVLESTNLRLDNISGISTSNEPVQSQRDFQSSRTKLNGTANVGKLDLSSWIYGRDTDSCVLAASVVYGDLLDYLKTLRPQSFIGELSGIDLSM